jgi:hypothetical protein
MIDARTVNLSKRMPITTAIYNAAEDLYYRSIPVIQQIANTIFSALAAAYSYIASGISSFLFKNSKPPAQPPLPPKVDLPAVSVQNNEFTRDYPEAFDRLNQIKTAVDLVEKGAQTNRLLPLLPRFDEISEWTIGTADTSNDPSFIRLSTKEAHSILTKELQALDRRIAQLPGIDLPDAKGPVLTRDYPSAFDKLKRIQTAVELVEKGGVVDNFPLLLREHKNLLKWAIETPDKCPIDYWIIKLTRKEAHGILAKELQELERRLQAALIPNPVA